MLSVRLPWATVPPKGDSFFARSTSTWIHWSSPVMRAKSSTSCWVTSRQSLGPTVSPTRPRSSSMPFTVISAMAERLPGRARPLLEHPEHELRELAEELAPDRVGLVQRLGGQAEAERAHHHGQVRRRYLVTDAGLLLVVLDPGLHGLLRR